MGTDESAVFARMPCARSRAYTLGTMCATSPNIHRPWRRSHLLPALCCALASLHAGTSAPAQVATDEPEELKGVGVDEKLDAQVPLDLAFTDSEGRAVRLGDYFRGEQPVMITLNYYSCPMLCTVQLNDIVTALKEVSLEPAKDFELVTISFDPLEGPSLAKSKKRNYVSEYGRVSAAKGWHFLTGKQDPILALCRAVGFKFKWNPDQQQWAHPATAIICTPDGRISRYLGLPYEPKTLRLSLVEASEGKIGTLFDKVFLTCFHYVGGQGQYTADVMGIMRLGGAAIVVILVLLFAVLEVRRRIHNRSGPKQASASGGS
jgi:protein SCO1/2